MLTFNTREEYMALPPEQKANDELFGPYSPLDCLPPDNPRELFVAAGDVGEIAWEDLVALYAAGRVDPLREKLDWWTREYPDGPV